MKELKEYASYLVTKFQGDIDFAMKVVKNNVELSLNKPDRFENEINVFQELEVLKASKSA